MNIRFLIHKSADIFDLIRDKWENSETQKKISSLMILIFLGVLLLIQLSRMGLLPSSMQENLTQNHLYAIDFAFNLLLIKEIFDMIFYLPRSISNAQRKQLQILALILIRFAFKKLSLLGEPIGISSDQESIKPVLEILAGGLSGLLIFVVVHYFYKLKNKPLLVDPGQCERFVAEKKSVALVLIFAFFFVGLINLKELFIYRNLEPALHIFFTIFIFADILIVLISMQYSQLFLSLFRNSGFALATVIARISVTAPPYYREALAISAAIFSYFIAYVYNKSIIDVLEYLKLHNKTGKPGKPK